MSNTEFYLWMGGAIIVGIIIGAVLCWWFSSDGGDEW